MSQEAVNRSMQTCGTYVKNKKSKNQQVLYVKMFGDFSLKYQGEIFDRKEEKRDAVCTGIAVDFP